MGNYEDYVKQSKPDAGPESVGRVLRLQHELHAAREQLRMMRDAMRAANLLPSEVELARLAVADAIANSSFNEKSMQVVDVFEEGAFGRRSITIELAFASDELGQFCTPGGIFIEEFDRFYAHFRRRIVESYAQAGGDTVISIRLVRCELTTPDQSSLARYERHVLNQAIGMPSTAAKPKSL